MKIAILIIVLYIIILILLREPAKRLAQAYAQRKFNRMREMEELDEIIRKKQEANYYRMKQQKNQQRSQTRRYK